LIGRYIFLKDIKRIYNATTDSLPMIGIWVNPWLDKVAGELMRNSKPVFSKLIVLEDEVAYNAIHLYVFDKNVNCKMVTGILKNTNYDYLSNKYVSNALRDHKIIIIDDVSP
jgi:hypothetical protein